MMKNRYAFLVCFFFLLFSFVVSAQDIVWQETTIPMSEAGDDGLETLLVWPNSSDKFPVVILSHGTSRDLKARKSLTAISYLPTAMEFARRGFAVAVVLRRGYGHSGGKYPVYSDLCKGTDYNDTIYQDAKDLHATVDYLATLPQFDMDYILPVGVSAGGLATIGLTAYFPPEGLVGAISFAGGRGSIADNNVCEENKLVAAFAKMGKTSRIPMLWVYAVNDHFFNPTLAARFWKAFNGSGGQASFLQVPVYTKEGHYLFSTAGIPIWTVILDNYLSKLDLPLYEEKLPLPPIANLPTPKRLSPEGKKVFLTYLKSPPHKAFAVTSAGGYGWMSGSYSDEDAEKIALDTCNKYAKGCYLYAINDHLAEDYDDSLDPPEEINSEGQESFLSYLKSPDHKGFAVSSGGAYSWVSGKSTSDEAQNEALEACKKYATDCYLYAVDDDYYDDSDDSSNEDSDSSNGDSDSSDG